MIDKFLSYFCFFKGDKLSSLIELTLWFAQNLVRIWIFYKNLLTPDVVIEKHLDMSIADKNLHDLES